MKTAKAGTLMKHPVRKLVPSATLRDATTFLLEWGISGAPVVDSHGTPVGVFSLTDVARYVRQGLVDVPEVDRMKDRVKETGEFIPGGRGFHFEGFEDTMVSDLMTPGIVTVRQDAPMTEVIGTMTSLQIHRVFVTGPGGSIEGVITTMDVLRWLEAELKRERSANAP